MSGIVLDFCTYLFLLIETPQQSIFLKKEETWLNDLSKVPQLIKMAEAYFSAGRSGIKSHALHTEWCRKHQKNCLVIGSDRIDNLMYFCITDQTVKSDTSLVMKELEKTNHIIPYDGSSLMPTMVYMCA